MLIFQRFLFLSSIVQFIFTDGVCNHSLRKLGFKAGIPKNLPLGNSLFLFMNFRVTEVIVLVQGFPNFLARGTFFSLLDFLGT
jgi:hypothetical protein